MKIGSLINQKRLELGLTLEEVGNSVGVSKSTVKKWEDGFISNMKRDKIAKLAKTLKINPVALITGNENDLIPAEDNANKLELSLSQHETDVIIAYREQPTMQEAVDRLLGVETTTATKEQNLA